MGHFSMEIYAPSGSNLSGNQQSISAAGLPGRKIYRTTKAFTKGDIFPMMIASPNPTVNQHGV